MVSEIQKCSSGVVVKCLKRQTLLFPIHAFMHMSFKSHASLLVSRLYFRFTFPSFHHSNLLDSVSRPHFSNTNTTPNNFHLYFSVSILQKVVSF